MPTARVMPRARARSIRPGTYLEIIADYKPREGSGHTRGHLRAARRARGESRLRAEPGGRTGLTDDELPLFNLLFKENISNVDRERLKQASNDLSRPSKSCFARCPTGRGILLHKPRWRCSFSTSYGNPFRGHPSRTKKPKRSLVESTATSGSEAPAHMSCRLDR